MADLPPYREPNEGSDHGSTSSTPAWVKVLAWFVGVVLILVFVGLHLAGVLGPGH